MTNKPSDLYNLSSDNNVTLQNHEQYKHSQSSQTMLNVSNKVNPSSINNVRSLAKLELHKEHLNLSFKKHLSVKTEINNKNLVSYAASGIDIFSQQSGSISQEQKSQQCKYIILQNDNSINSNIQKMMSKSISNFKLDLTNNKKDFPFETQQSIQSQKPEYNPIIIEQSINNTLFINNNNDQVNISKTQLVEDIFLTHFKQECSQQIQSHTFSRQVNSTSNILFKQCQLENDYTEQQSYFFKCIQDVLSEQSKIKKQNQMQTGQYLPQLPLQQDYINDSFVSPLFKDKSNLTSINQKKALFLRAKSISMSGTRMKKELLVETKPRDRKNVVIDLKQFTIGQLVKKLQQSSSHRQLTSQKLLQLGNDKEDNEEMIKYGSPTFEIKRKKRMFIMMNSSDKKYERGKSLLTLRIPLKKTSDRDITQSFNSKNKNGNNKMMQHMKSYDYFDFLDTQEHNLKILNSGERQQIENEILRKIVKQVPIFTTLIMGTENRAFNQISRQMSTKYLSFKNNTPEQLVRKRTSSNYLDSLKEESDQEDFNNYIQGQTKNKRYIMLPRDDFSIELTKHLSSQILASFSQIIQQQILFKDNDPIIQQMLNFISKFRKNIITDQFKTSMSIHSKQSTPDSMMSFDQPQNFAFKNKFDDVTFDKHIKLTILTNKSKGPSSKKESQIIPVKQEDTRVNKSEIALLDLFRNFPNFNNIFKPKELHIVGQQVPKVRKIVRGLKTYVIANYLMNFKKYSDILVSRLRDKEKQGLIKYEMKQIKGQAFNLVQKTCRMSNPLLKRKQVQQEIIVVVFQPESNGIMYQLRDDSLINQVEIRLQKISQLHSPHQYYIYNQEGAIDNSQKLIRMNDFVLNYTLQSTSKEINDNQNEIKLFKKQQKEFSSGGDGAIPKQNMTDVFGYVTKLIADGMYEIIEPYHEGFKQESPSPNKRYAKKQLMKELSLRSQDIVSDDNDNDINDDTYRQVQTQLNNGGKVFNVRKIKKKVFKKKLPITRLPLLNKNSESDPKLPKTYNNLLDLDQLDVVNKKQNGDTKIQQKYLTIKEHKNPNQRHINFNQMSPQLIGESNLLDEIQEEDDDTNKMSIRKKGGTKKMKHIKALNANYKFGDYLTINSFKSLGDNIGMGAISRINSQNSFISQDENKKDKNIIESLFYDAYEESQLIQDDNNEQQVLELLKSILKVSDSSVNSKDSDFSEGIQQTDQLIINAHGSNFNKSKYFDKAQQNSSFESEQISSSNGTDNGNNVSGTYTLLITKNKKDYQEQFSNSQRQHQIAGKTNAHTNIKVSALKSATKSNSKSKSKPSQKVRPKIVFENQETVSYESGSGTFEAFFENESNRSKNVKRQSVRPFSPLFYDNENKKLFHMTKEVERELDEELLENQEKPDNYSQFSNYNASPAQTYNGKGSGRNNN